MARTGFEVAQGRITRGRSQLALLDQSVELLLDLADAGLREIGCRIDDGDVDPSLGRALRDALAHLPGADDAEPGPLGHERSPSSAMPSPPPMHSDAPPVFTPLAAI